MKPERWKKIETICQKAMTLQGEERTTYLQNCYGDDGDLLKEVMSLLDQEDSGLLHEPLVQIQSSFMFSDNEKLADRVVGPYKLIRLLGTGGMGNVYLAVRNDEQFERFVALKVIKEGVVSDDILSRFFEERQILASLNHPNISRLFDGGTTENGLPWFAMEYVEGIPITDYCERQNSTLNAKLDLFLNVCSAVQYAHQNLVIHRDLKPANILITETGQPKLLDFGIAKLVDLEQEPGVTRYQNRLMTPEYASPEQVKQEPVSTVSDVYSLGVLLYELLTGELPYHFEKRSPAHIEEVISNQEPEKPSGILRDSNLKGDLDNIILKALKKNPGERYSSAEQFAEDIRRNQRVLPILAQNNSFFYRSGKFIRRHGWGVAASVVIALLVIMFAITTYIQSEAIEARAIEVENQRDRSEQVVDFLINLFEASDPAHSGGETITAIELLERGSMRIEEELGEQPEMQAEMRHVMGRVYESLDLNDEAERLVSSALNARRKLHGAVHTDVATSQDLLAELWRGQGKYMAADSLHRATLAMRKDLLGESHPDVAVSQEHLALVLHDQGDYEEAETLYRKALSIRRAHFGSARSDVATNLYNLAWVLHDQGSYDEAESHYREALAMWSELTDGEHPGEAATLNNLGWLMHDMGEYEEAEAILRQALALRRKLLGNQHSSVAQTLSTLAQTLRAKEQYGEAEGLYREALAVYRNQLGDEHAYVAGALNNLALLLQDTGDLVAAEKYLVEALAIQRKIHGDTHPYVAASLSNLGSLLGNRGDFEKAIQMFEEVFTMDLKLYGENHHYIATDFLNIAELKFKQEKYQQADSLFARALGIYRNTLPEEHPNIVKAQMRLGRTHMAQGKFEQAAPLFKKALEIRQKKFGDTDKRTMEAQLAFAGSLTELKQFTEAELLLNYSYTVLQKTPGESSGLIPLTQKALVDLYEAWGFPSKANPYRAKAN